MNSLSGYIEISPFCIFLREWEELLWKINEYIRNKCPNFEQGINNQSGVLFQHCVPLLSVAEVRCLVLDWTELPCFQSQLCGSHAGWPWTRAHIYIYVYIYHCVMCLSFHFVRIHLRILTHSLKCIGDQTCSCAQPEAMAALCTSA